MGVLMVNSFLLKVDDGSPNDFCALVGRVGFAVAKNRQAVALFLSDRRRALQGNGSISTVR